MISLCVAHVVCLLIRLSCFEVLCLNLNNIVRFVLASCATSVAQLVEHTRSRELSVMGLSPT